METRKFKTTAKCGGCVNAIAGKLDKVMARSEWEIDLASPGRVMTVNSEVPDAVIIENVQAAGFRIEKIS